MRHPTNLLTLDRYTGFQLSFELQSPKRPENIKITTLYRCTGRCFTAAARHIDSCYKIWFYQTFNGKRLNMFFCCCFFFFFFFLLFFFFFFFFCCCCFFFFFFFFTRHLANDWNKIHESDTLDGRVMLLASSI